MLTINTHAGKEPGDPNKPLYTETAETLAAVVEKLLGNRAGYHLLDRRGERPEMLAGELTAAWAADATQVFVWEHDSNSWYLCDTLAQT